MLSSIIYLVKYYILFTIMIVYFCCLTMTLLWYTKSSIQIDSPSFYTIHDLRILFHHSLKFLAFLSVLYVWSVRTSRCRVFYFSPASFFNDEGWFFRLLSKYWCVIVFFNINNVWSVFFNQSSISNNIEVIWLVKFNFFLFWLVVNTLLIGDFIVVLHLNLIWHVNV